LFLLLSKFVLLSAFMLGILMADQIDDVMAYLKTL